MKKEIKKQIQIKKKQTINFNWIIKITLLAFFISLAFSSLSEMFIKNVNLFFAISLSLIQNVSVANDFRKPTALGSSIFPSRNIGYSSWIDFNPSVKLRVSIEKRASA